MRADLYHGARSLLCPSEADGGAEVTMKAWQRSRRLGGYAALILGVAGMALTGAGTAQAGVIPTRPAAVVWGSNNNLTPAQLASSTGVTQVSAGAMHLLVLQSDGTVWTRGNNWFGQLGNGTTIGSSTLIRVPGLAGVVQVSAGSFHSLALRSDGTVWQWGGWGPGDSLTPVEVPGLTGVTKITAGNGFSLALRSDGTVWAWGNNYAGQLGDGTTTARSAPVQVSGLSQVTGIAAGADSALAVSTRGITTLKTVWAWGSNGSGQLGDGTLGNHLTPEQVTGIGAPSIMGISVGEKFAVALGSDGTVWAWGADDVGQLGNAPTASPVTRPVETTGMDSGITQISAGLNHVLALKSNGTVLAWGDNAQGELGTGSTASVTGKVQVSGLTGVTQVSAGAGFSLAIHPALLVIRPA
jgi:alpha-tubulin suppressor-like RCC1 family protein